MNANDIATTAETVPPSSQPTVYLSATNVTGHPCTLWDQQDVNNYNAMLTSGTNAALTAAYNKLVGQLNTRLALTSSTCTYDIFANPYSVEYGTGYKNGDAVTLYDMISGSTAQCTLNVSSGTGAITSFNIVSSQTGFTLDHFLGMTGGSGKSLGPIFASGVSSGKLTAVTFSPTQFTAHGVPIAQTQTSGSAVYLGDCTDVSAANEYIITEMGIMYILTGSQTYGDYARQMLLDYANNYQLYGHPDVQSNGIWQPWTTNAYRSALDGRISGQFLNDAFFLCNTAFGYDLIRNLPTLTGSDKTNIDTLFNKICAEFTDPAIGTPDYLSQGHNRSCLCAAGTLMAGYACDDTTLQNDGLYDVTGTGGIVYVHFGNNILPDGLWIESSIGYQDSIAACGVFDSAIMLEHHGVNAFGQYPIKRLLDSALYMAYPGETMLLPNLGNTGPTALLSYLNYSANETGFSYWYGYLYYEDSNYLPIMRNQYQELSMTSHNGAPSLFLTATTSPGTITLSQMTADVTSGSAIFSWLLSSTNSYFAEAYGTEGDPVPLSQAAINALNAKYPSQSGTVESMLATGLSEEPPTTLSNANFYANGYGIFRLSTPTGPNQLLVEYGSGLKSHGQPALLSLDLYAMGGQLMTLPGDIFPYSDPHDPSWYWTTLANNTVTVDGSSQIYLGNYNSPYFVPALPKNEQNPSTSQAVYGTAQTMGIQKVSTTGTNSAYAFVGVTQDRAVFITPNYMADLFGNFSSTTHTYDLAWHPIGTMTTSLSLTTGTDTYFASGTMPGYEAMTGVKHAFPTGTWNAKITMQSGSIATLYAAANTSMEVITGSGHLLTLTSGTTDIMPPVILERLSNATNSVYGNAIDLSGSSPGYVKGVVQEGGLTSGYALLKVQTVNSGTDLCYTSYTTGTITTQNSEVITDAQQAFVTMNGSGVQGLYLGGGTTLTAGSASIQREDTVTPGAPGLAYVELTGTGYVVGNMSPTSGATITVTLPGYGTQVVTLGSNSVSAPLVAKLCYQPFNFPTGSINGQTSGSNSIGFTGTWSGANPVVSPGLTYSGLTTIGNALSTSSGITNSIHVDMTQMPPADTYTSSGTTYLGAGGTTLWFSMLIEPTVSGSNTSFAALTLGGVPGGGGAKVQLGQTGTDGCWSITSDVTTASSHVPATTGSTYLLVMSVYWSGTAGHDQINMYVNPAIGPNPPGTPSASLNNITISQIEGDGGFNVIECSSHRTTTFDEISMGETWDQLW